MNIPPFPSQDLAKLVLGYLAEEQLMTAYDEFLQASPYLNAFGNEYDRIFMTSLKNILAEYRAVKIYVETCKPIALRRKLFQCTNLHEVVKFLIQHVDISKIQIHEHTINKCSAEKQTSSAKVDTCEVCKSLKLESCSCNNKGSNKYSGQYNDHCNESVLDSSVEATPLSDLPGNHVTTKKKTVSDGNTVESDSHDNLSPRLMIPDIITEKSTHNESTLTDHQNKESQNDVLRVDDNLVKDTDSHQMNQKDDLHHISNQVFHNKESDSSSDLNNPKSMGGYHNFATGVNGESGTMIVPDSSTSERLYIQVPVSADNNITSNLAFFNKMKQTRTQYLLKVAHVNNTLKPNEVVSISTTTNNSTLSTVKPKPDENKVKILSDVKVDSSFNNNEGTMKMPQVLKNATSTPLLQMQTIVINGTPVYRQQPTVDKKLNYTKDEIMAMPTIILAPVPGPAQHTVSSNVPKIKKRSTKANKTTAARSLCSLTIDVDTDHSEQVNKDSNKKTEIPKIVFEKETTDDKVSKTLDITCASAPKDNTVTGITETTTPHILPPKRKSSSTPRRSSHVRVLDFTTPRRILHETANQFVTTVNNEPIVVSKKTEVSNSFQTDIDSNADKCTDSELSKENEIKGKAVCPRVSNWDADLRALAVIPEISVEVTTPKPKSAKKKKRSKTSLIKDDNKQGNDKRTVKKRANKDKSTKKYNPEPIEDIDNSTNKIPAKPTINIISGTNVTPNDWTVTEKSQTQVKSNDEKVDTPEMEKMSLQNDIGAKLNISDFLETPYKQALYDIQMETPRFMAPEIPGDPMSDIKIMNIPTPKFLNAQTPSSYSSRPTDYSSGGSYYKPDDQDYLRISDDLLYPITSSVNKENKSSDGLNNREADSNENDKNKDKPCRPVRQCRKNVSYYNNSNSNIKPKEVDNKIDSSFSDVTDTSFCEANMEKEAKNKEKATPKIRSKMKMPVRHRKSPLKKEVSKSFLKIKPRRPTPIKKDNTKRRKKTPESSKVQGRKKITKKLEDIVSATPVITSVPTKSRRKSSTPRKLHCTKSFNAENDGHDSPELLAKAKENIAESNVISTHDSDTEQLPLRWSDDGSQDVKSKTESNPVNESEDIKKIQDYLNNATNSNELKEGCLHIDLVKRGFDLETAKIIERELLDASPHTTTDFAISNVVTFDGKPKTTECVTESKSDNIVAEKTLESDCSTSNNLQIVQQDEEDDDEIELSVHECNEDTLNFFSFNHADIKDTCQKELVTLKDKFSMEVCLDDDLSIRLRATPFNFLIDQEPDEALLGFDEQETEMAVRSISNMGKLYTPLKESIKAQCYEIFDSTLTSLDTPLKTRSPKFREEVTVTEIVLEVENVDVKEKVDTKKRKRAQSSNLSDESESKKAKPEAQYLLNSANIQNIDIESVLSKLHGP